MRAAPDRNALISSTKAWLSDVIIKHNFCPFAKREFDRGTIHYAVIETAEVQAQLDQIILHCAQLDKIKAQETSLLIFPAGLSDFEDYLDVLNMAIAALTEQGYEGIYQLASFHPDYRFDGAPDNDPANYTNRSPYPMIHILREASVTAAVQSHPDAEGIPTRNIEVAQELGLSAMRDMLTRCSEK